MRRFICSVIAVMLISCLSATAARANTIILTLAGAPTATFGGFLWTYNVELTNGTVDPAADNMFSIWDFDGLVTGPTFSPSALGANFTMTTPLTDPEEATTFSVVSGDDDTGMINIRGQYSGLLKSNGTGTPLLLGTVSAVSTVKTFVIDRYISLDTGIGGGVGIFTTQIAVPRLGGSEFTPLPSTAGLGLVLLGGLGFGRARRANLA